MRTKILNLGQGNGLVAFSRARVSGLVVLGICSESANFNLARRDGAVWINDYGEERVGESLLSCLCANINAAEPTAVARVAVIPSYRVLQLSLITASLKIANHVFICLILCID